MAVFTVANLVHHVSMYLRRVIPENNWADVQLAQASLQTHVLPEETRLFTSVSFRHCSFLFILCQESDLITI